ncbi:S-methyl-5'-thioadenosine phosphorylase [Desulforhopalus singaporensis]|uniref:Purine nucleoside phosphorylase n=1 Tax=Desulforhopalus singaporensis TaxID=91360 RepID=A0A1H0TQ80_9BACT|nr:S-methyl-5'-thioadenosine phosphorylase [Desulforhopalus singaporensis]SDP55981.1 methylthioadenosine phosphorylase [Desulforhopalus singaporensis]
MTKIGIIGGSGLDDPDILKNPETVHVSTRFGDPSSPLRCGRIEGVETVILARHGNSHQYSPAQVNNRANISALKEIGVTHIIATTACGSLKEEIDRGHLVVLDQFIDFTRFRKNTFHDSFANGAKHVAMAAPFDSELRQRLYGTASSLNLPVHRKGCVVTIEGPRFSTVAESNMFRMWGADVINMSTAPEAILANEAEIPYGAVAMSTDYDCWKQGEEPVTWDEILAVFNKNASNVTSLLIEVVKGFSRK